MGELEIYPILILNDQQLAAHSPLVSSGWHRGYLLDGERKVLDACCWPPPTPVADSWPLQILDPVVLPHTEALSLLQHKAFLMLREGGQRQLPVLGMAARTLPKHLPSKKEV